MITEKDREDAKIICSAIKIPIEISVGGLKIVTTVSTGEILAKLNSETIAQIVYGIRSESAEQARKDADEKLAIAVKALESASMRLAFYDGDYETLSLVRQALKEIQG